MAVLDARESNFPLLQQLDWLLQSVPSDPPSKQLVHHKLKHGWKNVILAVVDQGIVSYIRIADAGFGREKIYELASKSERGVKGGRGGRGRGRGRGNRS